MVVDVLVLAKAKKQIKQKLTVQRMTIKCILAQSEKCYESFNAQIHNIILEL